MGRSGSSHTRRERQRSGRSERRCRRVRGTSRRAEVVVRAGTRRRGRRALDVTIVGRRVDTVV